MITNLDAPDASAEHGGREDGSSDGSTFLLEGSSMFRPLMELLYMRLPPAVRAAAIRRTAAFLLENTFTSVTSEAAILCNALAWADPATAADALLLPLLEALERDVAAAAAEVGGNGTARLSRVAENALKWRLSLLSSTSYRLGPGLVPHGARVRAILTAMAGANSQAVQEATARATASVLQGLCSYYPLEQCAACVAQLEPGSLEGGAMAVEAYVDQSGGGLGKFSTSNNNNSNTINGGMTSNGTPTAAGSAVHGTTDGKSGTAPSLSSKPMKWHIPSAEEIALSEAFLEDFALGPARFLLAAASGAEPLSKEVLRAQLLRLEGALGGLRTCLPDFPGSESATVAEPVGVIGGLGPVAVGTSALRVTVAEAMAAISATIIPSDSESMFFCIRIMEQVLCAGDSEHRDAVSAASSWLSDDKWTHEPAVAGLLLDNLGDVSISTAVRSRHGTAGSTERESGWGYGAKWRRRRPMWVSQEKVYLNLEWRASQAAYRWYPSAAAPALAVTSLHPAYVTLLGKAVHLMLQGMRGVREVAGGLVERCMKRYPGLSPAIVAPTLCGIAKIQDSLTLDLNVTPTDVIGKLKKAAAGAAATAAAATAAGETGKRSVYLFICSS